MAEVDAHQVEILSSLEKHNATFTTLLSLIPSKFYIAPDQDELDNKFMKNKKRKTGEELKEHKRRAKQEKLDPANQTTAADLLESQAGPSRPHNTYNAANQSSLPPAMSVQPLPPATTISDLRARLQTKLDTFKKDRGVDPDADPQSRDALEEERRRKRGEMRDRRRNERKAERRKAREEPTARPAKTQLIVPQLPRESDSISYPSVSLPGSSAHRSKAPIKHISNPTQALAHLEKHNAKLASLPEDKRKEIEERERWAKAEERASGGKVVDSASTLKKAVRRTEKTKAKSGKEWSERKKTIEKSSAASIKKRNDNIASRIDAKKNKKTGKDKSKDKGKGKGKGRPGFEGGKKSSKSKA